MLAINSVLQPRIASKLAPTKTARLSDANDPYRICFIDLPSSTAWAGVFAAVLLTIPLGLPRVAAR
ncbi:MAG: hypothetical protein ACKVLM_08310 [Pseudomonadales bacterium]